MNWKPFVTHLGAGILGILLAHYAFPREVEKVVEVEKKVVEIKEVEVVKWKEKVKWKTRTEYRQDGSVSSVETCGLQSSSTTTATSATTTVSQESSRTVSASLSRYSLGLTWEAATNPADLSNYRLTAGARIGSLPVFGEVYLQGDLGFGVGLRLEW